MKIEELNLSSLKYFLDTVENGSFTRASEINFVSRPAISQAISRLEDWAGTKLLIHQKKKLQLTSEGEIFYRKAKISYKNFKAQLVDGQVSQNDLKLGCSASLAEIYLASNLKKIKAPIKLEIKVGTSHQLAQLLKEKVINIAIFVKDMDKFDLLSKVLKKGHFKIMSKNGKLNDLLFTTEDRAEVIKFKQWLFKRGLNPQIIVVESWGLCEKLAASLGGTCLIPDFLPSKLANVNTPGFASNYEVVLAHRGREFLSETEMEFCDIALES